MRWVFAVLFMGATVVSGQSSLPILFLGVANKSGYRGAVFREEVGKAFKEAMERTGLFSVRGEGLEVSLPLGAKELIAIGKALKASFLTQGVVRKVRLWEPEGQFILFAAVTFEAVIASVRKPYLFFRARGVGEGKGGAEGEAVREAVKKAVAEAARSLATIIPLKGQVLLPPTYSVLPVPTYREKDLLLSRTVRISLDMIAGISVGAEVVILKGKKPIASGRVVEVDYGSSLVALTKVAPDAHIHSGDPVRVTYVPRRPKRLPFPLQKEREYKRVEHDLGWALLIAGIAVAFIGE